jgi:hypothetical protein
MQPGLTPRRLAERRSYDMRKLDREVPSQAWYSASVHAGKGPSVTAENAFPSL